MEKRFNNNWWFFICPNPWISRRLDVALRVSSRSGTSQMLRKTARSSPDYRYQFEFNHQRHVTFPMRICVSTVLFWLAVGLYPSFPTIFIDFGTCLPQNHVCLKEPPDESGPPCLQDLDLPNNHISRDSQSPCLRTPPYPMLALSPRTLIRRILSSVVQ